MRQFSLISWLMSIIPFRGFSSQQAGTKPRLLEGLPKGADGGETPLSIFGESAHEHRVYGRREGHFERTRRRRGCQVVLAHDLSSIALKGWATNEQFVDHDSQRVLIAGRRRVSIPLFGSHVDRGATNALAQVAGGAGEFGDAEVGEQQVGLLWLVS